MQNLEFIIDNNNENFRTDVFLANNIDELSRSAIVKLIDIGMISVNGKQIKPNYKLKINDKLLVKIPEPETLKIEPENINLDIIFEDKDIIVINKEQGMVVHPAAGHYSGTLVNALLYHCGESLSGINGVLRPGIVHRIDKDTSGILVVAKNDMAHRHLSSQLSEHSMTRVYTALVHNNIKADEGKIDKSITRHITERKKMAVTEKGGKRAVTHYKALQRFGKYTLIEARLETGRTHQIRVHMSFIGHPIVGDKVYGRSCAFQLNGQALHAGLLGFIHPSTGEYIEFTTKLPEYFKKLLLIL